MIQIQEARSSRSLHVELSRYSCLKASANTPGGSLCPWIWKDHEGKHKGCGLRFCRVGTCFGCAPARAKGHGDELPHRNDSLPAPATPAKLPARKKGVLSGQPRTSRLAGILIRNKYTCIHVGCGGKQCWLHDLHSTTLATNKGIRNRLFKHVFKGRRRAAPRSKKGLMVCL